MTKRWWEEDGDSETYVYLVLKFGENKLLMCEKWVAITCKIYIGWQMNST